MLGCEKPVVERRSVGFKPLAKRRERTLHALLGSTSYSFHFHVIRHWGCDTSRLDYQRINLAIFRTVLGDSVVHNLGKNMIEAFSGCVDAELRKCELAT